jgi:hypothetical protein
MSAKALRATETLRAANNMFQGDPEWEDELDDMDCLDFINLKRPRK